ncbi:MAG: chitin disaccharide deacetylase [Streptococcaceae bacterium]|nr:chitin disaccharide deacetylase [Streptococcaceae bacterium]
MKLIINADDFGLSPGQNYGIIDCFKQGVVTATTLMATGEAFEHACQLALLNEELDLGVHLTLDAGLPILPKKQIPSLVNGEEFNKYPLEAKTIDVNTLEVYQEWHAQITKVIDARIQPTHIDSHHHIHMMHSIFPVYIQLAKEFDLAIRFHPRKWTQKEILDRQPLLENIKRADVFLNEFYEENIAPAFFDSFAQRKEATYEIMCHPAYLDEYILANSSYNMQRVIEAHTLQSEETKDILHKNSVELIHFGHL